MFKMIRLSALLAALLAALPAIGADLDKAKSLRANGLLEDAKRELLDVAFAKDAAPEAKAEALLILGDIAETQDNLEGARQNWDRLVELYPSSQAATSARLKLRSATSSRTGPASPNASSSADRPVLVVPDPKYPWAAPQIAGAIKSPSVMFNGSLLDAFSQAKQQSSAGVIEILLTTDAAFESGRVVCYRPQGAKVWEEKVMFNLGGGRERIARRFADNLTEKVMGRTCP